MHPFRSLSRIIALPALLPSLALAVPTAVNDTYSTPEDVAVSGNMSSAPLLVTGFEAGAGGFTLPANWDYLDTIPAAATTYPVDGASASWKATNFDKTTSTVAGWKTSVLPIQGGGVDAWLSPPLAVAVPSILLGITGGQQPNTVTTYLFRTTFTMTAAEAAVAYSARVLADDGCIVYINGVEAGRLNYPAGVSVSPDALVGGQGGSETAYANVALTVPFVAGANTIAVELHQNTNNSSDAGIDLSLILASADPLRGLGYVDDVDGTTRPASAAGALDSAIGNPGSSVNVGISRGFGGGGGGGGSGANVSGGWRKTIAVPTAGNLRIQCDARARTTNLEDNEFAEAIVMLDGARLSITGRNYLVRQVGPNPAATPANSGTRDSNWGSYTIEVPVTAGNHVITFGGFGPRPSIENNDFFESGAVNFDNINVSLIGTAGSLLDNDTGGVAPVTAVKASDPAHGSVTVNASGSFTYTPALNYFGTDTFTYKAVDGTGESAPATVTITVTPVNDVPVAVADGPHTTPQGEALIVGTEESLLANDTDAETSVLTAVMGAPSLDGTTVLNPDGSFTFTPNTTFAGTATFTYRASDGASQSAPATVTINVTDLPDPPGAVADTYTVVKNTPLVITATAGGNITDEVLPYKSADWHYFNSLIPANRNLGTAWRTDAYTENADWLAGPAELGFGDGDEGTAIADNPDPAFDQQAADKFVTSYFRRSLDVTNLSNITGVEIQMLFDDGGVFFINGVEGGRSANLNGTAPDLAFDFLVPTQQTQDNATQTFTLPASVFLEGSNLLAAEIHQNAPTSSDLSFDLRIRLQRAIAAGVLANDADPDPGQTATLVAEIVSPPGHGALVLNSNGTFTFTPANGYTGPDSFTYRAKDSTNLTSGVTTANLTIVTGPNVPPVANPDTYTVAEDAPLNVTAPVNGVLANDTDVEEDAFTAVVAAPPAHGTLTLNPNGTFTYQPAANFNGTDSFTYRATDTRPSSPATVTITVTAVNDPPVSANDSYAGDPGVPFVVAVAQGVLANDSDVDAGTVLTAEIVTPPATGSLTLNADGSFTFTAAIGGVYSFTYRAKDATSQSGVSTATISLNAVPVTQPDSYTTDEDQTIHGEAAGGFSVLVNDSDPEGQPLTAALATNVQHGTLELEADGGFHYTPAQNYFGSDSFTYRASDGTRTSGPALVSITINAVNDAPVAAADTYGVRIETPLVISAANGVLRNDTDVDNSTLTAALVSPPVDGTLVLIADGSFTYTPLSGFSGARSFTYRASDGTLQSALVTVTLNVTADLNTVTISEIMYNPPGATGAQEEFIEIYNYGDAAVELTGWEFTKGVNYAFPAGTLLAGKGYLAIPANKAAFTAKYPGVTNVTAGGWNEGIPLPPPSSLGNGGELIRLKNAAGIDVDEVEYSDSGDWAERRIVNVWDATNTPGANPANGLDTDPGLEWYTTADPDPEVGNPGGSSIQIINTALSNNAGANWTAALPTPGAANAAVARTNSAPLIRDVIHSPAVPNATQQVFVTARIDDEQLAGTSASVFYRTWGANSAAPDTATFIEVPMADNGLRNDGAAGDGVLGAVIPAQALNKVVEFYVQAADAATNVRTWPAPALDVNGANPAQNANCLYQVNEEVWTDHRPLYQLVLTGADNAAFNAGLTNRQTNVAPNATVIFRQGGKFDVRYLGGIRPRGNSSRSDTPMNLRMDIPGDNAWNGRTAFTLNYKYSYCQFLATRLLEAAGVPCEKSGAVGMRLNGLNRLLVDANGQPGPNGVRTFGYYCDLIPRGGDTIKEWFPGNDNGNGYGKIRAGFGGARWQVSTLPVIGPEGYATGGYVNEGYTKQTNAAQNDWTDVHAWMQSLQAGTNETFHTVIANTVDIDEWCRFLAVSTIINHGETNMANGDDDDYSIYFGATDKLCRIIAHDLDTCFNLNAIGLGDELAPANTTIYQCTDPNYIDNATLPQMDKFYRNPVTGRKFKAALRHYLDTLFAKATFDATVEELLDSRWMGTVAGYPRTGDEIRTHIKTFLDQRRVTIATFLPTAFTAATSLTVQDGLPRSTSASDLGGLGGKIDPARTAEVKVNGIKVTTNPYGSTAAADNSWSAGTAVTLAPGINTLTCTAHDENGAVFATQTVTIWYDASGVTRSGTLAASETWSPAAGPYNLTASITVPSGMVLTIEPGTTVFLATGADINVSAGGRIQAVGTPAAAITLTRIPSGTGTWGGITISGASTVPTVMSYVTFENNGDTAIHTQNGASVELDHLTFKNAAEQFLSFDGSSFLVRDCLFPATPAGTFEPVHGTGGIAAGGRGIIQDCRFGKTSGYQDTIDFTGGNRPGPILHVLRCTFEGSDDDMLDLDSTDAWVEGCTFMHCHRNGSSPDSSSGVSGGADNNDSSQVTVINNLFYDCDNAVTMKAGPSPRPGNSAVLLYNTIVHITRTGGIDTGTGAVNFDDDNVDGEGKGMYLEGNIIWDVENLTRNYVAANSQLTLVNNILPVAPPAGATASGNIVADPLLNLSLISNPATATLAQVQAALTPQACSPAFGNGPFGFDPGATPGMLPFRVQQLPGALWPASFTLNVGPGGSFTPTGQAAWQYGYTHYVYALDGNGPSAEIPAGTPISFTGLTSGPHEVTIYPKDDTGELSGTGRVVSFTVASDAPTVVLSEISAAPSTGSDWIELHNYGSAAASLTGCSLSAADSPPLKYTFGAGAGIPAGGRILVDTTQLGFNLNRGGETITLTSPSGGVMDTVTFGPQITDRSIARVSFGWSLSTPTPAAANTAVCLLGAGTSLHINEWLGSNDIIVAGDFVELYNGETSPVSITGWRISQDFRNEPEQNVFPPLSFIAAGGFLELIADGDSAAGADHLNFKVSSLHDSIALLDPAGQYTDSVYVLPGNPDVSKGRLADGSAITGYLALPTPGFSNGSDLSTDTPVRNGLRITELMFDAPGSAPEFIEFKNISAAPLTVTGVSFASGIIFTFPATTLAAGAYGVITNVTPGAFTARYPGVTAGQWTGGRLDNNGETIRIETGTYGLGILDFRYQGDWYAETRSGASLEFLDPAAAVSTWGDKTSWQPSVPSPGGPGAFGVLAPQDLTIAPPGPAILHGFVSPGTYPAGSITVAWSKVSGPGSVSFTAPSNKDTDATFSLPGTYDLRLTATPPGGAPDASDTVTVTVAEPFESYDAWAARTLAGYSAAQQDETADADNDGNANLIEHVLGTNPAVATPGPELLLSNGRLALRYTISKTANPAIQVIPQIGGALAVWQDGPAVINDFLVSETAALKTRIAEDTGALGAGGKKFLRLKVVRP